MGFTKLHAQTGGCDTIYNTTETMPHYKNETKGLFDYITQELSPVLAECMKHDNNIVSSLQIILTIDRNGKVIDVDFPQNNLSSYCKNKSKEKLMTMQGWTPGYIKGQAICNKFNWPIKCLKWE